MIRPQGVPVIESPAVEIIVHNRIRPRLFRDLIWRNDTLQDLRYAYEARIFEIEDVIFFTEEDT